MSRKTYKEFRTICGRSDGKPGQRKTGQMKVHSPSALKKILPGNKVLVDSNIIIYLTDDVESFAPISRLIFQMVKKGTGKQ